VPLSSTERWSRVTSVVQPGAGPGAADRVAVEIEREALGCLNVEPIPRTDEIVREHEVARHRVAAVRTLHGDGAGACRKRKRDEDRCERNRPMRDSVRRNPRCAFAAHGFLPGRCDKCLAVEYRPDHALQAPGMAL
jgi:hypothetical protein